jgi:methylglyoxal/glyoxal reductase
MDHLNVGTRIELNDGNFIPQLGLGVFQLEDAAVCERAVVAALACGYRHIDTAAIYGNEEAVGRAIAASGIPREELFITTKCWIDDFGREATRKAFDASRKKLGLDVVDLYLLHWPVDETMMGAWETLVELRAEGAVRSIGVSNFSVRRFEELFFRHTDIVPAVNQIELHPFGSRPDVREYCAGKGIAVESYSPLARMKGMDHPELAAIAAECGKTPAQVVIRWHLQHGLVAIPKSQHPERIRDNADVFDFALTDGQMRRIDGLNEDRFVIAWRPGGEDAWY